MRFRSTALPTVLKWRAALLREIRRFFDDRDFFEVQTPVLSHDVLVDRYIEPIDVLLSGETLYLQTSPEFAMKRLLASGCERIYQITPAFRRGDRGPFHNVEFTMLEWYRVGDGYEEGMNFLRELSDAFLVGTDLSFREMTDGKLRSGSVGGDGNGGNGCDGKNGNEVNGNHGIGGRGFSSPKNFGKTTLRSFASVFEEQTGVNPHTASSGDFRRLADRLAPDYPASFVTGPLLATTDDWLDYLFSEVVQPTVGLDCPIILYDYPVTQSQLAKVGPPRDHLAGGLSKTSLPTSDPATLGGSSRTDDRLRAVRSESWVTRRFELFVKGIELANGYDELTDASVLRSRFQENAEFRRNHGFPPLPVESRLLTAMDAGLPKSSGCALGIDRLLMIRLGLSSIDEAISFPIEEA